MIEGRQQKEWKASCKDDQSWNKEKVTQKILENNEGVVSSRFG